MSKALRSSFRWRRFFISGTWFWPLVAMAIAGLGWLVYQLRIRRLRERYDLILAERSRIARELHDTLIQGFSGITMAMQALAARLRSSPQERETLEDIIRDAATCLRETRQSVAGLRAGHDAESGLAAAIGSAAREITDTKDVRLKLKLDRVLRKLPAEVEYNLLRIASEAVSNSVKHSGARNIEVALESTPEALRLRVHDDGSGLGKDGAALRPGHYGIIGMKERATQIGADLELLSEPGHGTTVSVLLPARRAAAPAEKVEALAMSTEAPIRVLCADDHPLVRKGIASILANETDVVLVGEAGSGQEAVEQFRKLQPDVVLMDLRMPEMTGIEATRIIRSEAPEAKIIALTSYDGDQDIYRAIEAGVRGYILKEMVHTEVLRAIRTVHAGKRLMPAEVAERLSEYFPQMALTPREVEVLRFVAKGMANKEIAHQLGTASGTIKMHIQNILAKLDASDRTHAVTIALERGILHLDF